MKERVISLFSGCGGMDIGFEGGFSLPKNTINEKLFANFIKKKEGKTIVLEETIFETVFANDINTYAKIAWDNYFQKKRGVPLNGTFKVGSIVDFVKIHQSGESKVFPENIDVVTGGFPCQDFSVSGKRKGFDSHKDHNGNIIDSDIPTEETRGKLYMWMRTVIQLTKPKIFIAENVKGLANLGEVKEIIQNDFSNIDENGYLVLSPKILHAANFGVPQSRERIFFIGLKKSALRKEALEALSEKDIDEKINPYPTPTHRINGEFIKSIYNESIKNYTKSSDVLLDLVEPEQTNDPSQRYYSKAKFMGLHCQGQKEVNLEKLAPTIRAEHHGNIEFRRLSLEKGGKYSNELNEGKRERRLTPRECARIQTFPDDFNFVIPSDKRPNSFLLSASEGYRLVGNAVPPLLAYHIAKKIESNWNFYFH